MKQVKTPCSSCTQLWASVEFEAIYVDAKCSQVEYDENKYEFFHHPGCGEKHLQIESPPVDFIPGIFCPIKELENYYDGESKLYFSNAIGTYFLNSDEYVLISGQGRDTSKNLSFKKSIYELIERISNIYLPVSALDNGYFPCDGNDEKIIQASQLVPSGLYGLIDRDLPLNYGIAVHDTIELAIENARYECLEKFIQYHSLKSLKLQIHEENDDIKILRYDMSEKEFFVAAYIRMDNYPYQLLTSSVSFSFDKAQSHAKEEILEKKDFLMSIENNLDDYSYDLYPWMKYACEKETENLYNRLTSGEELLKDFEREYLIVSRENILTKQMGIFAYQVFLKRDERNKLALECFPYG